MTSGERSRLKTITLYVDYTSGATSSRPQWDVGLEATPVRVWAVENREQFGQHAR